MPAIMAHHQFGVAVLRRRGAGSFPTRAERDAFLLGCQGPDPFFFAARTLSLVSLRRLGTCLHSVRVLESIEAMLAVIDHAEEVERPILTAFMSGYLCHFSLDSTTHPYIYALEEAFCNAGVEGLDKRDRIEVHAQIESNIDTSMMWHLQGKTIADFRISLHTLQGDKKVLRPLDVLFVALARELYKLWVPSHAYSLCVHDMRMVYDVLQSPKEHKRMVIGSIERLIPGRRHSVLQALSPRVDTPDDEGFMNSGHNVWTDPFTGTQHTESFVELFDAAIGEALACVNRFLSGGANALALTKGKDFKGSS